MRNSHATEDISFIPVQRRRFLHSIDTLISGRHTLLRACQREMLSTARVSVVHVSLTTCHTCHKFSMSTATDMNVDSVRPCQLAAILNQVMKMCVRREVYQPVISWAWAYFDTDGSSKDTKRAWCKERLNVEIATLRESDILATPEE
jgi:hypothetical protein